MSIGFSPHTKYYNTGLNWLGDIPASWKLRRLGSYFQERRSKVSDADYPALSVTMQGIVPQLETAAKTDDGDNRKLVEAGDFVINSRSDRKGSSGISSFEGSVSLISIVLKPISLHPPFIHHLLRSEPFQEEFYRFGKGIVADLWSTNYAAMKNIVIPIAPLEEQTQIAKFLDYETARIDALIEKQQQLIALLKEKRQAVISHAVTKGLNPDAPMRDSGVEWLGEVPAHWETKKLKHLVLINPSKNHTNLDQSSSCTFLPMEKLKTGIIVTDETAVIKTVFGGYNYFINEDILMAKVTPCFENKNIAIAKGLENGIGFGSTEIYVIRPLGTTDQSFLCYRLQETTFMNMGVGAMTGAGGLKRVPSDFLQNFPIALPPLSEQQEIATHLRTQNTLMEKLSLRAESGVTLLQERRTALISAAVTGKIDVRNWQAPEPAQEAA